MAPKVGREEVPGGLVLRGRKEGLGVEERQRVGVQVESLLEGRGVDGPRLDLVPGHSPVHLAGREGAVPGGVGRGAEVQEGDARQVSLQGGRSNKLGGWLGGARLGWVASVVGLVAGAPTWKNSTVAASTSSKPP